MLAVRSGQSRAKLGDDSEAVVREAAQPAVFRVVYDEARVVVVDKAAGVASEDVAAALARKLVHRIDKSTSGLLVLADDARTVQRLQRALAGGDVARRYRFVAHGVVDDGRYTATLVRDRGDGLRGSGPGGKAAALDVGGAVVADTVGGARVTVADARLLTGRTHQIRIQLAEAGHPLVGERVYVRDAAAAGLALLPAARLLLHAASLAFVHPNTHATVDVTAPLPPDFLAATAALGVNLARVTG
jgi:23S rRNA pseudouridine1911/1915/1917 synthase